MARRVRLTFPFPCVWLRRRFAVPRNSVQAPSYYKEHRGVRSPFEVNRPLLTQPALGPIDAQPFSQARRIRSGIFHGYPGLIWTPRRDFPRPKQVSPGEQQVFVVPCNAVLGSTGRIPCLLIITGSTTAEWAKTIPPPGIRTGLNNPRFSKAPVLGRGRWMSRPQLGFDQRRVQRQATRHDPRRNQCSAP